MIVNEELIIKYQDFSSLMFSTFINNEDNINNYYCTQKLLILSNNNRDIQFENLKNKKLKTFFKYFFI